MRIRNTYHTQLAQIIQIKVLDREWAFLFHLDNGGGDKFLIFKYFEIFGKLETRTKLLLSILYSGKLVISTYDEHNIYYYYSSAFYSILLTFCDSIVADMRIILVFDRVCVSSFRITMNRKSMFLSRSCTSSRMICV